MAARDCAADVELGRLIGVGCGVRSAAHVRAVRTARREDLSWTVKRAPLGHG